MADGGTKGTGTEPVAFGNKEPSAGIRLLVLGTVSLLVAGYLFFFRERIDENFLLALLGILGMVGVFYLFASVTGFVEFTAGRKKGDIGNAFLDSLSDGICITDDKNAVVYANGAYRTMTGAKEVVDLQSPEQVLSRHDDAANALYRLVNDAQRGKDRDEEFRLPGPLSGDRREAHWFRASVHHMKSPATKQPLRVWRLSNITDEREQQERYFLELQKAIDHLDRSPVGFFSSDADGRIQYVNATLAEWLGLDLANFVPGQMVLDDVLVGEGAAMLDGVRAEPGSVRTAVLDAELSRRSGERMPVQLIHRVQANSEGLLAPTRTIVLNDSEAISGDRDERLAEKRLTRFFNSTPMAIAALDRDGRIVRTNASFSSLFAGIFDRDAIDARIKFETGIHERDRERFAKALDAAAMNQAKIEPFDTVLPASGPDERHVRIFVNAVSSTGQDSDVDAPEEAAMVYAMDTTEQRALEAQMAQSQKMQAVGQLAGGIAHDFNNVLTAIIMASDLLLTSHRPSDPSFADIMNIKQNANRAASLVRQLLAFSRRQTLRPEVLGLTDVLADLRMLLARLIGNKVKLTIEHGRDLWPVKADLGQFEQVIVNLTVNARDAMPEGGDLVIRTRNVEAADISALGHRGLDVADYVQIDVVDNGTGIAPDVIEKIFEPFFTTKEVGKGTGLGLSMVYGIIKQTGGYIYADSKVGEGTTFSIFLPRHIAQEGEDTGARAAAKPEDKKKDLSGSATILLVEDEDAVRMGGVRALTSRGYTVHEASSGVEALDVLEELDGKVDLIVSDVVMPEMDGPSLLREVRKDYPGIKFIFVSGYAEDAFAKNLPEGAQFGFLPKPFSLKQLATTVKDTLDADG